MLRIASVRRDYVLDAFLVGIEIPVLVHGVVLAVGSCYAFSIELHDRRFLYAHLHERVC